MIRASLLAVFVLLFLGACNKTWAPVDRGREQRLLAVRRTEEGHEESDLGGVIFVPLLAGLS